MAEVMADPAPPTSAPKRRGNYWLQDGDLTMHIRGRYDPEVEGLIVQVARLAVAQYEREAERKRLVATLKAMLPVALGGTK